MIKSTINRRTDVVTTYKSIRKMSAYVEEKRDIFRGVGGCLQFGRGELGCGRRRRNRGGQSRQSVDLLAFTDGITDGHVLSVYPSVSLMVNGPYHCTEIPV
jgi:hypothetical protein